MKKIFFFYINWIIAAIFTTNHASALIATKFFSSATHIVVTSVSEPNTLSICDGSWDYKQFMIIDGHPEFVFTQSAYSPGRMDLVFYGTCDDGYFIYGLNSCGCLTDENRQAIPSVDAETTITTNLDDSNVINLKSQQQPDPSAFINKISKDILRPKDGG